MSARPYAEKKFAEINGVRMAYLDEGEGDPIVFQHGNPTSSYLWRDVMPHLQGLGRLIACDLVGMGDSGKLSSSGPDRYSYQEQRDHLFALWEQLGIGDNTVLVLHDWGSALGFDWASSHREQVAGIASPVPKLFVNAEPGGILIRRPREFCRTWANQTEVTVPGVHFVQEDSPDLIGTAVADFVRRVRGLEPNGR
jgi:alpha-beta hydrolase superfamily lysophospholipase